MKLLNWLVLSVVIAVLALSGCTAPEDTAPATSTPASAPSATPTQTSTDTPAQVSPQTTGDLMDSEISTIESDMAELDALLADMEDVQDINFTELEGLDF